MKWIPLLLSILLIILVVSGSRIYTNDTSNSNTELTPDPKIENAIKVITPKK